ncbi:MAG: VOC family protein [Chitinophagales bacterium]
MFRSKDVQGTKDWYAKHLGLDVDAYGSTFTFIDSSTKKEAILQWSPMEETSDYIGEEEQQVMVNYRVDDLDKLLEQFKQAGVKILGDIQSFEYGRFLHIIDNEGRRVELWEPIDGPLLPKA